MYDNLFPRHYLTAKNRKLNNKHEDLRAFCLLTGDSLSHIDIHKLKNEITIAPGFSYLSDEIINLPLTYYFSTEVGKNMDRQYAHGWWNWPEKHLLSGYIYQGYLFTREVVLRLIKNGTIVFFNADQINYFNKINLFSPEEKNVYFLKQMGGLKSNKVFHNADLTKRFSGLSGSVFNIILLLMKMGVKEIYLCGAGYTYSPTYEMHYYNNFSCSSLEYTKKEAMIKAIEYVNNRNILNNVNLTVKDIYKKNRNYRGILTQPYTETDDIRKHRLLLKIAKENGVSIYNITPDGFESPVYDKISWTEVLDILEN